ncbi:MAG TPA: ABC transporter permease [Chryseolinea sp.]
MNKHFLKIFYRNLLKNRSHSFINIFGLFLGLAAFALIALYVLHERSYDNFHAKKDHIFRVRQDRYTGTVLSRQWTAGPWGIGADLKNNFPEVVRYVNVNRGGVNSTVLANGDIFFEEDKVFFASRDFFKLFSYPLLEGVDSLVLKEPFTMVVSESLARRYFGETDPIGKTLINNGKEAYTITGVFKDVPENTHLKFEALFSFESLLTILGPADTESLMSNWGWSGNYTYIELAPSVEAHAFESKLPAFVQREAGEVLKRWGEDMAFVLQSVPAIHLTSDFKDEIEPNGNERSVSILGMAAFFILGIAWINYINLTTARLIKRGKETGVRKVLGSSPLLIFKQFLFEAFITQGIALIVAAMVVWTALPYFETFTGRHFDVYQLLFPRMAVAAVLFFCGVLFSGIYPALILSSIKPVHVLKGRWQNSAKGVHVRIGLVSFQIAVFTVLVTGTLVIAGQLRFMKNNAGGLDLDQVMVIKGPHIKDSTAISRFHNFKDALLQQVEIVQVAASSDVPGRAVTASNGGVRLVNQDAHQGNAYRVVMMDDDFADTYGLQLVAGRKFSPAFNDHWKTVMVNETAMKVFGFTQPEKILGQKIYLWGDVVEIVGVVKDYNQEYLRKKVDQLIFVCDREIQDYYSVKIKTSGHTKDLVAFTEAKYKTFFPGNPFDYFFADDYYQQQYQSDERFGSLMTIFTIMAIAISCLGLIGLSSYLIVQRTKEMSIRKVLGASISQIAGALSKEYLLIALVSSCVASPVAYWLVTLWISDFAYRMPLTASHFLVPVGAAFMVVILTAGLQALKAAFVNPVHALKDE